MNAQNAVAIQYLLDRIEIEKLAYLYARGNDIGGENYDLCMTEDVEVIYPTGRWQGRENHKARRDAGFPVGFTFTQHVITNAIIDIDGDTATAQYYCFAAHGMRKTDGKDVVYAGAIYTDDCVRTPEGWRIKRRQCECWWFDDRNDLMNKMPTTVKQNGGPDRRMTSLIA